MLTTLGAARLPQHLASPTLRHVVTSFRRAQKFPEAASFRMVLSSFASASKRSSRAFSFSSAFSRFTWSVCKPRHARPMAYESGRLRTEAAAWPVVASLKATMACRTTDMIDNAAFLVVDQARDMFDVPIPSGTPNIDVPQ